MPHYSALWKKAGRDLETETPSRSGEHFVHASQTQMFVLDPGKQLALYGFSGGSGLVWDQSSHRNGGSSTGDRRLHGNTVERVPERENKAPEGSSKTTKKTTKHGFFVNLREK